MEKTVLVCGGSRGIGRAAVEMFASRGWKTAFVYNKSVEAAQKLSASAGAEAIQADLSDFARAEAAAERAIQLLGHIDALVNCAGIACIAQICDTDEGMWRHVTDTNLTSAYAVCKAVSAHMVKRKSGSIVNVGSVWGRVGASCETAYSASKAGIRGLTLALAKELAPSGIRVNCVEPGVIDTEMNASLGADTLASLTGEIPLGRLGTAREAAELIYFLAGDSASYITGQLVGVDGGFGL